MPSELLTERCERTLVLTLSGPGSRNALSPQVCAAGVEALNVAADDAGVRSVVLRGGGEHFCAGSDFKRLAEARALGRAEGSAELRQAIERLNGLVEALRACPKPVIAAVEGDAAGAGFSLALACDLVVAADDARFVMSHGHAGLSPDGGATWHLAQGLPRALVLQMLWLAEPVSAAQLRQWGLVAQLAPRGEALSAAMQLARRLAAMAPNALASAKELVALAPQRPLGAQLADEAQHFIDNLFGADGAEGLQAFLEQRAARFG